MVLKVELKTKGDKNQNLTRESFKLYLLNVLYEKQIISEAEYYKIKKKIIIFNTTNDNKMENLYIGAKKI